MRTIQVRDGRKFEANPMAGKDVADNTFGAKLAFLDQKIELDGQAQSAPLQGFEEKTGHAEIAFVVIDDYQGQGIGTLLMRHLAVIARKAGLKALIADVLPENAAMRKVFGKFGFQARRGMDPQVVHLVLTL